MNDAALPGEIVLETRSNYVYCRLLLDRFRPEVVYPLFGQVVSRCHELKLACVLVDCQIHKPFMNTEAYMTIRDISSACPSAIRLAFVERDDIHRSRLKFGCRFGADEKFQTRVFEDIESAEKWLGEHPSGCAVAA